MLGKLALADLLLRCLNSLLHDGLDSESLIRISVPEGVLQVLQHGFGTLLIYTKDQSVTVKNNLLTVDFSYLTDTCVLHFYSFLIDQ